MHSSTLVTAGIYLLFRFENFVLINNINLILLGLGVITIFMARGRAFFEIDMKKIVALSTLSQLGVIICALGRGFAILAFFHLVAHAFFKALLFIRAGRLIHASESYQDLRVIGGTSEIIPYRIGVVIGCSGRLRGLPFISAFYSKEIIIERCLLYNLPSYIYLVMVVGIFITVFYRIRFLVIALIRINRHRSIFNKSDRDKEINFRMVLLFIPAISGGRLISIKLDLFPLLVVLSLETKFLILRILRLGILIIILRFYKFSIITTSYLL